jgi:5-deoxy-glucuronate isomerase
MTDTTTSTPLFHRAGELARGPWALEIDPERAGWGHTSLRILELPAGGSHRFTTGDDEMLVLPLAGSCLVDCDGEQHEVRGRAGVFAGATDFVYVPRDAEVTVSSQDGGRFALPGARARRRLPVRYGPKRDVPVELRGAGMNSRQVVNFCTPDGFPHADQLIAVEVYTPSGNWSSYPPHKHDEDLPVGPDRPNGEAALEEVYYFEVADGPHGPGMAYQRVYGTDERPIDVLAEVRTGDVVLVPHGWHGPSMSVPGYHLYYLNAMAGPGEDRAWRICNDPAHSWVIDSLADAPIDPRLPLFPIS